MQQEVQQMLPTCSCWLGQLDAFEGDPHHLHETCGTKEVVRGFGKQPAVVVCLECQATTLSAQHELPAVTFVDLCTHCNNSQSMQS